MLTSRVVLSRASRSVGRRTDVLSSSQKQQLPPFFNRIDSLVHINHNQFVAGQISLFHHSAIRSSFFQQFGFTSSASTKTNEKEESTAENNGDSTNMELKKSNEDAKRSDQAGDSTSAETKESDSDAEGDLSMDDLVKLVVEKEELLKLKHKEIEKMQDKVLRSYAEMENVMERTKREGENSRKFAIQSFAKSLLDVADNLGRASSVVKDSFLKIDTSTDTAGAVPLLKTLLEGVDMTEKQLTEVLRKFGVEKYDPLNEPFDPHRHNAVFQVPDPSKPPGTVAAVLKAGYVLHDRVIRPAEVGVTKEVENDTESNN